MENEFYKILRLLLKKKKLLIKNVVIAAVAAIVIAFSIPKEYTAEVIVAPELNAESSLTSGLGTIASMAGVNLGGLTGSEALYPDLYPEIVATTPFLMELLETQVMTKDGELKTTLHDYLEKHQSVAWWEYPGIGIGKLLKSLKSGSSDFVPPSDTVRSLALSKEELGLIKGLEGSVSVKLDKLTNMIFVSFTAQDPLVAADMVTVVTDKLQKYVEDYRTAKAREDLSYVEKLCDEAKRNYTVAMNNYSIYADSHQNLLLETAKREQERLENEMSLAFNAYSQLVQQKDIAMAKVQEKTPVYVVLQPSVVPEKPSSPKKIFILAVFVFLSLFGTSLWILMKEHLRTFRESTLKKDAHTLEKSDNLN